MIDAQPTWGTETLPLAYLGTSLALGAFAYALVAAATKTPADKAASAEELGGKLWPAVARLRRRGRRGHSRLRAVPRP